MDIKFNKDGPVTFGALGGTYPQMNAQAGEFSVVSGIVRNGVLGPAVGDVVRPDNAASVTITLNGVKYTADSGILGVPFHLVGPVVNEYHKAVPLTNHLTARWVIRKYVGFDMPRVDLTIENDWAYEPGPQNFTYDVEVSIGGNVVYSQAALTHLHHARWRMVFNDFGVVADYPWLGTRAIPHYGPEVPNEAALKDCAVAMLNAGPMKIGAATAYMPTTGAHNDIGILPSWQWAHIMSHDPRARACTLATGDGAGSFSMHYRDKATDLPVALKDHPRMTIAGHASDAGADAFPALSADSSTPYTQDIPHHPSLAFYPYLLTGDYYYLEELQFLANYCAFASNPGYRGAEQGLVQSEQMRGQAWALRTIGQAAYITPDSHPLKADLNRIMDCNLDWYNARYPQNPSANKIGVIENGYAIDDEGQTAIKPWMLNFFVASLGYNLGLGFEKAAPILDWTAAFPVGCMTAPGVCWMTGAAYILKVRDTPQSPVYDTIAECYTKELGPVFMSLPCAGSVMASAWGTIMQSPAIVGDMSGYASGGMGYPSNMQGALKYAVDRGIPNAQLAWDRFMSRTVKCDYSFGGQFNLMPESYVAKTLPPVTDPIDTREWGQIGKEGDIVTVPADTIVRYGADGLYVEKVCDGAVPATNAFFGMDPAPNVPKILQQLIPQPPEGNPMSTFTVSVELTTSTVLLPAGSEAAPTSTLVEILDADKVTVLGSTATAPYSLSGITAGDKFVRTTDYDSKGAPDAAVLTPFTITDDVVVTPPTDPVPVPVEAQRTTGVTVTYVKD